MKITATRRLQFAIGHRIVQHESKCRHLHGHNFVFFLTTEADVRRPPHGGFVLADGRELDSLGRVIDFGVLKAKLGGWLEANWDHGFVLWEKDQAGQLGLDKFEQEEHLATQDLGFEQKLFLLPYNPTAENLARYLLEVVGPQVLEGSGVRLVRVDVDETENGRATATL